MRNPVTGNNMYLPELLLSLGQVLCTLCRLYYLPHAYIIGITTLYKIYKKKQWINQSTCYKRLPLSSMIPAARVV